MNQTSESANRNYDLVSAMTPDNVKLHGIFQHATPDALNIDAAVVLHGLGGNFYSSSLNLRLGDALREIGISVVLGNTRGHDSISMSPVNGRAETIGAAYEIVDDCRFDVAGWVDWLVKKRDAKRIALVAHSLGAIKSLYAQAHMPHQNVVAIVGLSATRLCHEKFLESSGAQRFKTCFAQATQLVEQNRHTELMKVDFPFPTHMCAGAYFDKYGPKDRYDWIRFADKIDTPCLLMFGQRELSDNPAFHGLLDSANDVKSGKPNYQIEVIESANHFYAGVHWRATDCLRDWLKTHFTK